MNAEERQNPLTDIHGDLPEAPMGVTVFGASSPLVDRAYIDGAYNLGKALAEAGYDVITGGGRAGLMAAAIEGARDAGGTTVGVLPSFMIERKWNHPDLTRTVDTPSMHVRKSTMASMSRASVALPGGCGTLDELMEIITWRQLGLYQGHVVIFNINDYYRPIIDMLDRAVEQHFMNPDHTGIWHVASTVDEVMQIVASPIEARCYTQKL